MLFLTVEKFNGFFSLAHTDEDDAVIQDFIDRFEIPYVKKILGVVLGEEFIEDVQGMDSDSSAIEDRFQILIDGFMKQQDNDGDVIHETKGMEDILAHLVFYEYASRNQVRQTQAGATVNQSEISNVLSIVDSVHLAEEKWNECIMQIRAIQWWCGWGDPDNYPEYNGITFKPKYADFL